MEIQHYLSKKREVVEEGLQSLMLAAEGPFADHIRAMRYSLFVGGKRVRPILVLAAGEAVSPSAETQQALLPVACALEFIHTYSLIHDDLPAMDDDALRRGQPTNHMIFGEAGAILAGDGLLTLAFDLITDPAHCRLPAERALAVTQVIARAAGPRGMVGGQALDIASENSEIDFSTLQTIHRSKTGELITASVLAGGIAAGASVKQQDALKQYGDAIGLAFQIVDDLLNVTSTPEQLGKATGTDAQKGKATYPAFFGVEGTRQKAREAVTNAQKALKCFDDKADPLRQLAEYIVARSS